jgi:hypothetical protein
MGTEMSKAELMALVGTLMEKTGDLAIAASKGKSTAALDWAEYCALRDIEEAVDKLMAGK